MKSNIDNQQKRCYSKLHEKDAIIRRRKRWHGVINQRIFFSGRKVNVGSIPTLPFSKEVI